MDSPNVDIEKCFIDISETCTEDEMSRRDFSRSELTGSEISSELSKSKMVTVDSDICNNIVVSNSSESSAIKSNLSNDYFNSNPNLIYSKNNDRTNSKQNKERETKVTRVTKTNINKINTLKQHNCNSNTPSSTLTKQNNLLSNLKNDYKDNTNTNQVLKNENENLNKKLHDAQKSLLQYRQEKIILEDEVGILKLEKEKILSIKESQLGILNEKIMKMDIQNDKLLEMNEFMKKRIEEFTPKVHSYDELIDKYRKSCLENEKLSETNMNFSTMLSNSKKENEENFAKYELLRLEAEALKNDKFYLSKESISLNEKLLTSYDKIKNLEDDIREMRKINQTYLDKLTEKNLNIENSYENKLRQEMEEMKKKYDIDKENLKKLFEELAEKRCTYLQEEKEEYKSKSIKYEKNLKDKEEAIDMLNNESRNLSRKTDEELSFLRIQLKVKVEELERLRNIYEENSDFIKLIKNENELVKEKNDIIRCELIRKESDFRSEISELKAQLSMTKEKILNYEQIENELDKVILDSTLVQYDQSDDVMNIIKDIPTTSKRRISQCLILANKLKIITIEMEKYKNLSKKLEKEIGVISDERDLFKSVSDKSKQPFSYLINNIQDLELELYRKNLSIEEKDQSIKSLLRDNETLNEKVKAMESDMKTILNNRKKLDNLEDIIKQFIEKESYDKFEKSEKSSHNYLFNSDAISTNYNNNTTQNICSPMNRGGQIISHTNYNSNSLNELPERDTNVNRSNYNSNIKIPRWYQNMKSKNINHC